ncbi:MAG: glutathione transferase GstA [Gallionellaceae bacterium]|jgi:glutathione S-transferase|nr:glutathione transferase GstA [Gallionellaceae bacterium]
MKLYYAPGACSLASHITLQESGLPFQTDKLDFATRITASGEKYADVNPKGYVPALRLDDGSMLTEGVAIMQYVADRSPASNLAPAAGTLPRYHLQEWLNFIATEIHKSYGPMFAPNVTDEAKARAFANLERRYGYVEASLAGKDYLLGSNFTVADAYLFTVSNWSKIVGFDLSPFPNVQAYLARIAARPAVQAALKAEGLV